MNTITWGDWFGEYNTIGAARRYLTMQWTGPRYSDDQWIGVVKETAGVWQVCVGQLSKEATK